MTNLSTKVKKPRNPNKILDPIKNLYELGKERHAIKRTYIQNAPLEMQRLYQNINVSNLDKALNSTTDRKKLNYYLRYVPKYTINDRVAGAWNVTKPLRDKVTNNKTLRNIGKKTNDFFADMPVGNKILVGGALAGTLSQLAMSRHAWNEKKKKGVMYRLKNKGKK